MEYIKRLNIICKKLEESQGYERQKDHLSVPLKERRHHKLKQELYRIPEVVECMELLSTRTKGFNMRTLQSYIAFQQKVHVVNEEQLGALMDLFVKQTEI